MDKDLLRLCQEYTELAAKYKPIRIEYNFLMSDIENKKQEHKSIEKSIDSLRSWLQKERTAFETWRDEQVVYINNEKVACDSRKNEQLAKYTQENTQLEVEQEMRKNRIKEWQKTFSELSKENDALTKENARIKKENAEYAESYNFKVSQIKEMEESIKIRGEVLEAGEKELKRQQIVLKKDNDRYTILKDEVEKKTQETNVVYLETIERGEEIYMKENEINNKLQAMEEKKADTEATYIKSKELMQVIEEKELSINKKISEFQEEKFKFLVLMKQKGIKKSDIDELEKDFNL